MIKNPRRGRTKNSWSDGQISDLPVIPAQTNGEKMKNPFDMQHYSMNESSTAVQVVQQMFAEGNSDIFYRQVSFVISRVDNIDMTVFAKIKQFIKDARVVMLYDERTMYVIGSMNDVKVFIQTSIGHDDDVSSVEIKIYSDAKNVVLLQGEFEKAFKSETLPSIKWWYIGERGPSTRDYYLSKDKTEIHPEFYPDLGNPAKYIEDYMNSDEAILLIAGPPGTGKTTLLRHMIHDYKLSAHVIYDERIMEQDSPFQNFLFSSTPGKSRAWRSPDDEGGDIMIIEDADVLLTPRERDGNKLMSRFLNISDGLIKLPNKKLVFTTNLTDFSRIDPAIMRPGRCFGVMNTRALNLQEAQAAAKVAKLPIPTEKREYTLAELFNQGKKVQIRTIGFGVRH